MIRLRGVHVDAPTQRQCLELQGSCEQFENWRSIGKKARVICHHHSMVIVINWRSIGKKTRVICHHHSMVIVITRCIRKRSGVSV